MNFHSQHPGMNRCCDQGLRCELGHTPWAAEQANLAGAIAGGVGMSQQNSVDPCDQCKRGRLVQHNQELRFIQYTNKGYMPCRAVVPMWVCDTCGAKTWDETAEAIIEEAIQREYDEFSKR
jgi:hypothetical protein